MPSKLQILWQWNCNFSTMILSTIKDGKIVPSEVTVKLIQKEMESSDSHRFLIDGFPRTEENRIAFEKIVSSSLCFLFYEIDWRKLYFIVSCISSIRPYIQWAWLMFKVCYICWVHWASLWSHEICSSLKEEKRGGRGGGVVVFEGRGMRVKVFLVGRVILSSNIPENKYKSSS